MWPSLHPCTMPMQRRIQDQKEGLQIICTCVLHTLIVCRTPAAVLLCRNLSKQKLLLGVSMETVADSTTINFSIQYVLQQDSMNYNFVWLASVHVHFAKASKRAFYVHNLIVPKKMPNQYHCFISEAQNHCQDKCTSCFFFTQGLTHKSQWILGVM